MKVNGMGRIIPYMTWKMKFMFETTNQPLVSPKNDPHPLEPRLPRHSAPSADRRGCRPRPMETSPRQIASGKHTNSYRKLSFIVSFPINSMVIFHSFLYVYQRVSVGSIPLFPGFQGSPGARTAAVVGEAACEAAGSRRAALEVPGEL